MIINRNGAVVHEEGTPFTVGGMVFANHNSEYNGLFGTVFEIRNGDDRETENDTTDIYCDFQKPRSEVRVHEYEERFSHLYQHPKKIDELALDYAIMAPEMLVPIPDEAPAEIARTYTATCYFHTRDGCIATTVGICEDVGVLIRVMLEDVRKHSPDVELLSTAQEGDAMFFDFGVPDEFYAEYRIAKAPVYFRGGIS